MKFDFNAFKSLVIQLGPSIIAAKVPHGDVLAPYIVKGIILAETFKGKTGSEKLEIAKTEAAIGLDAINAAKVDSGQMPINSQAINGMIESGISTVVNVVNLVNKTP